MKCQSRISICRLPEKPLPCHGHNRPCFRPSGRKVNTESFIAGFMVISLIMISILFERLSIYSGPYRILCQNPRLHLSIIDISLNLFGLSLSLPLSATSNSIYISRRSGAQWATDVSLPVELHGKLVLIFLKVVLYSDYLQYPASCLGIFPFHQKGIFMIKEPLYISVLLRSLI